jgi:hypothetical protein
MFHEDAIHAIIEKVWCTSLDISGGRRPGPPLNGGFKTSRAEAELCARERACKFHHHGFNAEADYWWGREADGSEEHRFTVRPATPRLPSVTY